MSECACLYNEGEPCELSVTELRTARKEHQCYECDEPIQRGQRYEHTSGRFEGEFFRHHVCLACMEIAKALYCDGRVSGCLWEDVKDQIFAEGGMNSACLDKLHTPAAKQCLSRRWWAWVQETGAK